MAKIECIHITPRDHEFRVIPSHETFPPVSGGRLPATSTSDETINKNLFESNGGPARALYRVLPPLIGLWSSGEQQTRRWRL